MRAQRAAGRGGGAGSLEGGRLLGQGHPHPQVNLPAGGTHGTRVRRDMVVAEQPSQVLPLLAGHLAGRAWVEAGVGGWAQARRGQQAGQLVLRSRLNEALPQLAAEAPRTSWRPQ